MGSIDRSDSQLKQGLLEERSKSQRTSSKQQKQDQQDQQPPEMKKIFGFDANLIALSTMNFFQNAAISVIVPFFPPLASNIGVTSTLIGLILAFNPIGSFLVSLIVAQMMGTLGKKNLMCWGLIFQAITIASFGALSNLRNEVAFICLSILSRFVQGAARSAYGSSTFSYVPQLWPDSVQKKISIMETLTALGTILGPMIGQVLYTLLGGQIPFYVLSFLFFCCLFTIRWLPPDNRSKQNLTKVSSIKCLTNKYIFMTFLVLVGGTTAQTYINTLYSKHMDELGMDDDTSGYVFSVGSIFYMLFLHLMPRISKFVNRKVILTIGIIVSILGTEVQAPEKYLGLPSGGNHWYIVTIGQSIINISFAMCVLPMIPELIELTVEKELKERNQEVADPKLTRACSDMSSGIFMAGYSLGLFIGPFGSGVLYDTFEGDDVEKFMNTSRCIAGFLTLVSILYLTVGGSYRGFKHQAKLVRSLSKKSQKNNEDAIRDRKSQQKIDPISFASNQESAVDSEVISSGEMKDGFQNRLEQKSEQILKTEQKLTPKKETQKKGDSFDSDILLSDENNDYEQIISQGEDSFEEANNEDYLTYQEEIDDDVNQNKNINDEENN